MSNLVIMGAVGAVASQKFEDIIIKGGLKAGFFPKQVVNQQD